MKAPGHERRASRTAIPLPHGNASPSESGGDVSTRQFSGARTVPVGADEAGMRLDRFVEAHCPTLAFSHIQRIIRKGELRVDGRRADPNDRLAAGQAVRIPPMRL